MKKKVIPIIILAALVLLGAGAFFLISFGSKYEIVVDATDNVTFSKKGFEVEEGESVTIPNAMVCDRDGNYCKDFLVTRTITDENGEKKAGTLQMKHGQVYTVTYVADNGTEQLEKEVTLYCYDTVLPTVSFLNLQKNYNVGDEISIKVRELSSDLDYKASKIKLVNKTTKKEVKLDFKEEYKFVAKKEAEQYCIVSTLKDVNGNENTQELDFYIAGQFKDDNIKKNNIWDFDEEGYMNNVILSGESDDLDYKIVTKDLPKDKKEVGVEGGALKLSLKANETYTFTLVDGNAFKIIDCATIGFNIWADEVVDIFEVYNVEDGAMADLSWKAHQRKSWQKVEFDPIDVFAEDLMLDTIKIVLSCEEDVTVYIDSIYYTDYVEPWRDEDLPKDVLALFDDERYLERVSAHGGGDATTFGAKWEYVTKIAGTTDFTGGALKFISTTNANGNEGGARDGFSFKLFDRLSASKMEGLIFRIYCADEGFEALSVAAVDRKMGTSPSIWPSTSGSAGKWVNVVVTKEQIEKVWDGYENITDLEIRFIRPRGTQNKDKEEYVVYIDKISLYELDYRKVKYTFADEYDMRVVSGIGNATPARIADKNASDGWAAYAKTVYAQTDSGLQINFNQLEVSKYAHIYLHVRATDSVSISLNGKYADYRKFDKYTKLDLIPLLEKMDMKTLKSVGVGRTTLPGVEIYVDGITFVTKEEARIDYSKVKYTFADDYDMKVVSSMRDAEIKKVADKDANDGWAAKGTTVANWDGESGIKISFDNLDVSKYAHIYMRVKTTKEVAINVNDKYVDYRKVDGYKEIDILEYASKIGATRLETISIGRQALGNIDIYVDEIRFVTLEEARIDYSKVKYTFADDYDMKVVNSLREAKIEKVADQNANDGWVAKGTTVANWDGESAIEITFDNVDISKYAHVYMRVRTTGDVSINVNGQYVDFKNFSEYKEVDIIPYLENINSTTLQSISIGRRALAGIEIYVDRIRFEESVEYGEVEYKFADQKDMQVVLTMNQSIIELKADDVANDDSALYCKTAQATDSGVKITFDNLDVSKYEHIYLRLRTTDSVSLALNDTYKTYSKWSDYTTIDLLDYIGDITTLESVSVYRSMVALEIYIDEIVFVEKTASEPEDTSKEITYAFKEEADMQIITSTGAAWPRITSDNSATDKSALYCTTDGTKTNSGVSITFDNLDVTKYEHIYVKIKTSGSVCIGINGAYKDYQSYANYTTVDLLSYITSGTLQSASVYRDAASVGFWIDEIVIIPKEEKKLETVTYAFKEEADMQIITSTGYAWPRITSDNAATDKSALYCTTDGSKTNSGVSIAFDNLDVTKYEHIYVKIKTSGSVCIGINGAYKDYQSYANYTTVDLLSYITSGTLQSASVYRDTASVGFWIDEITVVPKQ